MARIEIGLLGSKYSIHDLSKTHGEGQENLARFNMPLELGMVLGIRCLGESEGRISGYRHDWLALVPDTPVHRRAISDLDGFDASTHDETPATVLGRVQPWLRSQPDFIKAADSIVATMN